MPFNIGATSAIKDDLRANFISAEMSDDLSIIPGVGKGEVNRKALEKAGIFTPYQLLGQFLLLKAPGTVSGARRLRARKARFERAGSAGEGPQAPAAQTQRRRCGARAATPGTQQEDDAGPPSFGGWPLTHPPPRSRPCSTPVLRRLRSSTSTRFTSGSARMA